LELFRNRNIFVHFFFSGAAKVDGLSSLTISPVLLNVSGDELGMVAGVVPFAAATREHMCCGYLDRRTHGSARNTEQILFRARCLGSGQFMNPSMVGDYNKCGGDGIVVIFRCCRIHLDAKTN
jgi:hypothetical protein